MSLPTLPTVQKLQTALHANAKGSPKYRFYSLYDNICRKGWANYFCLGTVSRAYRVVNYHAQLRLRQWLCRKHKAPGRGTTRYPLRYAFDTLHLYELRKRRPNVS